MKVGIRTLLGLLCALLVGIFAGFLISDNYIVNTLPLPEISESFWISTLSVAAGGVIAAYASFHLKSIEDKSEENDKKVNVLSWALSSQSMQLSAVLYYKKQLDRIDHPMIRALKCPIFHIPDFTRFRQDFASLRFLIHSSDPLISSRMVEAELHFEETISAIEDYKKFSLDELDPALRKCGLRGRTGGIMITEDEMRDLLGSYIFDNAMQKSKRIYSLLSADCENLAQEHIKLARVAEKLFPREKFFVHEVASKK